MAPAQNRERAPNMATSTHGPIAPQRPVRFVTNNDEPLSKRRRISAACRTCQRKKTKCSGEKPDCRTCLESDTACLGYPEQNHGGNKGAKVAPRRQKQRHGEPAAQGALPYSQDAAPYDNLPADSPHQVSCLKGLRSPTHETVMESGRHVGQPEAANNSPALTHDHFDDHSHFRNRVPYFRYFGPTAMVPGFKQMVVELSHPQDSPATNSASTSQEESKTVAGSPEVNHRRRSSPTSPNIPFYCRGDRAPVNPLIKELCSEFFTHLGCNYPFLTHANFMRDLEDRKLDAILVDAVCAIAARFSQNPELAAAGKTARCDDTCTDRAHKSNYGCVFARRAMSALTKVFACPTLAAVQACLLLAYEQFGADHDSGLWVYLGLSIRMAQDLGMQKLEGLQYEGHLGPTPKTAKNGAAGKLEEQRRADRYHARQVPDTNDPLHSKEQRVTEKERINTFWAIFFLDRVVSSGTGRPVTLRDKDIEISFPPQDETDDTNEWPAPFPALIRIVHSYGRVANLLNNIREANQLTPETMKQLVAAEDDLIGTNLCMHIDDENAERRQHYLKHSQATNFILLHFWFHTLIVLLHQPTLLHSFEGRIEQLFPNSQELSLSSAKTIADILSFAELLDSKSFIGNPFTSQPMYFAACAFLLESTSHSPSRPHSRAETPPISPLRSIAATLPTPKSQDFTYRVDLLKRAQRPEDKREFTKRSLLAAAASQNYQRCYKALKALETYWAGARYIVTVLDQKAKGSLDPLLYTAEYLRGASESHGAGDLAQRPNAAPEDRSGTFSAAGHEAHLAKLKSAVGPRLEARNASRGTESSHAIGWSLTGSSDSTDSNLSVLYQMAWDKMAPLPSAIPHKSALQSEDSSLGYTDPGAGHLTRSTFSQPQRTSNTHLQNQNPLFDDDALSTPSNFHYLSPTSNTTTLAPTIAGYDSLDRAIHSSPSLETLSVRPPGPQLQSLQGTQSLVYVNTPQSTSDSVLTQTSPESRVDTSFDMSGQGPAPASQAHSNFNDMIIESQNIDTSALGLDPLLWLDYVPQDALDYFHLQDDASAKGPHLVSHEVTGP